MIAFPKWLLKLPYIYALLASEQFRKYMLLQYQSELEPPTNLLALTWWESCLGTGRIQCASRLQCFFVPQQECFCCSSSMVLIIWGIYAFVSTNVPLLSGSTTVPGSLILITHSLFYSKFISARPTLCILFSLPFPLPMKQLFLSSQSEKKTCLMLHFFYVENHFWT